MDLADIEKEFKLLAKNSSITPEPQASFFKKYVSITQDGPFIKDIVSLCNSHGIQVRHDAKSPLHWRSNESEKYNAPVLSKDFLEDISTESELIAKLEEMPKEWTVIQITRESDSLDVFNNYSNADPTIIISRLPCGGSTAIVPPYSIRIPPYGNLIAGPNIVQRLDELMQQRREFYSNSHDKKLQLAHQNTDTGLASYLTEIESYWIREWKCLLSGSLKQTQLEMDTRATVKKLLPNSQSSKIRKEIQHDIVYHLALNAHNLKDKEILEVLKIILLPKDELNHQFLCHIVDEIKSLNLQNSSALKKAQRNPVLLIVDSSFELIPWEMTSPFVGNPVCRVLSLHFLHAMFKYHEAHIVDGYRLLPVDSAYCLLNPNNDLASCEKRIGNFLMKEKPWIHVETGKAPEATELVSKLSDNRIILYCGHGSGSQYFTGGLLKKSPINGVVFLYGCCSNLPRGHGGRTPYQNDTYTYLCNGCPSLIGALYDLSSSDADLACMETLTKMLPSVSDTCGKLEIKDPHEPDVVRAVNLGKSACMKFCTKCAFVIRGIPVRVVISKQEKINILKKINRK